VEAAPTIKIVSPGATLATGRPLLVSRRCTLTNPAFGLAGDRVTVLRSCDASGSFASSDVVVYDARTGLPVGRLWSVPRGETVQSLSVDAGGHVLLGVATGGSLVNARLVGKRLVPITTDAPAGAW
jgi:hypothetical protein